ncbi:uncharacterized protein FA14DRAFT_183915 [Meira miltonrushii]|uniref:Uncharacterized protein n=1 Tax=Meira miltonrushii TaxID=1280837 RepID=A0A316VNB4_9BASI|nr:uncharacterized protein FA14DRAFT_183915 [Meira miltonrushii]PWN38558.1 hypothetical protein FA14DRAFT_183915 [Meira miltonrushii]
MKSITFALFIFYLFDLLLYVQASSEYSLVKRGGGQSSRRSRRKSEESSVRDQTAALPGSSSLEWGDPDAMARMPSDPSESLSPSSKRRVNRRKAWSGSSYETSSGSTDQMSIARGELSKKGDTAMSRYRAKNEVGTSGNPPGMPNDWSKGGIVTAQDGTQQRYIHIQKPIKHKSNSVSEQLYSGKYPRKATYPNRNTKVWRLKKSNDDAAQLFTGRSNRNRLKDIYGPETTYEDPNRLHFGRQSMDSARATNQLKTAMDLHTRQDHVFKKKRRASETPEERKARKCKKKPSGQIVCER